MSQRTISWHVDFHWPAGVFHHRVDGDEHQPRPFRQVVARPPMLFVPDAGDLAHTEPLDLLTFRLESGIAPPTPGRYLPARIWRFVLESGPTHCHQCRRPLGPDHECRLADRAEREAAEDLRQRAVACADLAREPNDRAAWLATARALEDWTPKPPREGTALALLERADEAGELAESGEIITQLREWLREES